jgi:hypothetical protein
MQRSFTIVGSQHLIAASLQIGLDQTDNLFIIVNNQDTGHRIKNFGNYSLKAEAESKAK